MRVAIDVGGVAFAAAVVVVVVVVRLAPERRQQRRRRRSSIEPLARPARASNCTHTQRTLHIATRAKQRTHSAISSFVGARFWRRFSCRRRRRLCCASFCQRCRCTRRRRRRRRDSLTLSGNSNERASERAAATRKRQSNALVVRSFARCRASKWLKDYEFRPLARLRLRASEPSWQRQRAHKSGPLFGNALLGRLSSNTALRWLRLGLADCKCVRAIAAPRAARAPTSPHGIASHWAQQSCIRERERETGARSHSSESHARAGGNTKSNALLASLSQRSLSLCKLRASERARV